MHPGTYIGTICMIFAVCIGVYCFKDAGSELPPMHQLYSPVSSQHAIVNDNVEVAQIYRCADMAEEPRRCHNNHDLHIDWEATM